MVLFNLKTVKSQIQGGIYSVKDQQAVVKKRSSVYFIVCDIVSQGKLEEWRNWDDIDLPQTETITTDKFWWIIFSGGNFFGALSPVLQ